MAERPSHCVSVTVSLALQRLRASPPRAELPWLDRGPGPLGESIRPVNIF
jgi:hypothetical protein